MKKLWENESYIEDVGYVAGLELEWEKLRDTSFLISGASGNIGSFLIDVLMSHEELGIRIFAMGRNEAKAKERFANYWDDERFTFVAGDINKGLDVEGRFDYVIHAASNTHPKAYATDPIGTVTTNIIGTDNMLGFAADHGCKRFLFLSSVEVYGENRGDVDYFDESYCGYIDCNTMRAGYPESKRAGEALCQAYISAKDMDIVIPRLSRTYGPTLLATDTKAISQFIHKGVAGEDIVLKSEGTQNYSYSYVADAVSGIMYCLMKGEKGQAYNIADPGSDITLKDLAGIIAEYAGKQVVFELPDAVEAAGYSKATKALLDASKLRGLGWSAAYDMKRGLTRTVDILREIQ
ncbi:MAG: NAD-dependent epimerase/dehydratase family protein [Lachnospiraceae bacterium]|nr:NAD-dependent epimerase/dehydratase family protein [Lachnospiraceae bacterium]